jgi:hypothetical protein
MNMETAVKCKKCGRVLKSPLSIAMGMGPKCAGVTLTKGKRLNIGLRRSSGRIYNAVGSGSSQMPMMMISQTPEKKLSRKEHARRQREERRRLFEGRCSFQCGTLVRSNIPLMYEPVGERDWKDNLSGRVMSQEQLQAYLMRYRFI